MASASDLLALVAGLPNPFGTPLKPGAFTNAAQGNTAGILGAVQPFAPANPAVVTAANPFGGAAAAGSGTTSTGKGVYAPFGQPGGGSDSPPAWLAKNALAAYQSGNTKYRDHLLADPTIAGNPHLKNFIVGLFAGDPGRIAEAQHYATNPSYNGWNNAAGDGIPGDLM